VQQRRLSRAVEVVLAAVVLCATSAASNANALDAERRLEKARALHLSARAEWLERKKTNRKPILIGYLTMICSHQNLETKISVIQEVRHNLRSRIIGG